MTMHVKSLMLSVAALALAGCTSQWDMQGVDPKDYYDVNPIENKVATRSMTHVVHYDPQAARLSPSEIDSLKDATHAFAPDAVESLRIQLSEADMHNDARRAALSRTLYSLGYTTGNVTFEPSATLARDDIQIGFTYARVIIPEHCPDWRTSPVTSYSNTWQGNFKCASVVNLGLMAADPHDLQKGNGASGGGDSTRDSQVVRDYRGGKDFGKSATGGSSSDTSGQSSSAVAAGVAASAGGQ